MGRGARVTPCESPTTQRPEQLYATIARFNGYASMKGRGTRTTHCDRKDPLRCTPRLAPQRANAAAARSTRSESGASPSALNTEEAHR
jgi:hypothetical protein